MKKVIKLPIKTIITVLILCVMATAIPLSVKAYNNNNYHNCFLRGQEYLNEGYYEKAVKSLDKALKYTDNNKEEINKLIDKAIMLNLSKNSFDEGIKQHYNKDFKAAIASFIKVKSEDVLRYSTAQTKIKECKMQLIAINLEVAKKEAQANNYEDAINYLNTILEVDPENSDIIALKIEYSHKLIAMNIEQ